MSEVPVRERDLLLRGFISAPLFLCKEALELTSHNLICLSPTAGNSAWLASPFSLEAAKCSSDISLRKTSYLKHIGPDENSQAAGSHTPATVPSSLPGPWRRSLCSSLPTLPSFTPTGRTSGGAPTIPRDAPFRSLLKSKLYCMTTCGTTFW